MFKHALQNVKIKDNYPFAKNFVNVLMCDNNLIFDKEKLEKNVLRLKNKNLVYSGFQLGITYLNQLNNNIRDLHDEIDSLKGTNTIQNNKIKELELQNTNQNNEIKN